MTHYIATVVIVAVFGVMAFAAEQIDRYRQLADHADQGVGADEYAGPRRYTRPTDRDARISNAGKGPISDRKRVSNADRGRVSNAIPRQQKALGTPTKKSPRATDQNPTKENRS